MKLIPCYNRNRNRNTVLTVKRWYFDINFWLPINCKIDKLSDWCTIYFMLLLMWCKNPKFRKCKNIQNQIKVYDSIVLVAFCWFFLFFGVYLNEFFLIVIAKLLLNLVNHWINTRDTKISFLFMQMKRIAPVNVDIFCIGKTV